MFPKCRGTPGIVLNQSNVPKASLMQTERLPAGASANLNARRFHGGRL